MKLNPILSRSSRGHETPFGEVSLAISAAAGTSGTHPRPLLGGEWVSEAAGVSTCSRALATHAPLPSWEGLGVGHSGRAHDDFEVSLVTSTATRKQARADTSGAVLILVLWIAFGLVVLAIHFADSMRFELRAADNRTAATAAEQAAEAAARYVKYVLENQDTNGILPDRTAYLSQEVAVGDAAFWLIGRPDDQDPLNQIVFALVDEGSKLNLNTATSDMLQSLPMPNMTAQMADAIVDWRDADEDPGQDGAENEVYARLNPARTCKNARFETVEELRLVYGITLDMLYGEDVNRNGLLDPNEDDGDLTWPPDNRDGRLDPGLLEYVTVYSRQPNTQADGSAKTSVNNRQQLQTLFQSTFDQDRAQQLLAGYPQTPRFNSVLAFYANRTEMTAAEFRQIEDQITATNAAVTEGLVNINTASEAVLQCIPGIGTSNAPTIIAYRQSNPDELDSLAWVKEVLSTAAMTQAGPYLTGKTYQFTADVAAVGRHNRGFRRIRYVFDTTEGEPKVVERQDLTHLGWALGADLRETMQYARLTQP
jgi:DNA uptake protein ComE-like DNA-binding protein